MAKFKLLFFLVSMMGSMALAGGGSHFGFNAGFGVPYTTQFGLNFVGASNCFSADVSYNTISITSGFRRPA